MGMLQYYANNLRRLRGRALSEGVAMVSGTCTDPGKILLEGSLVTLWEQRYWGLPPYRAMDGARSTTGLP
jgi:hypothetical protein